MRISSFKDCIESSNPIYKEIQILKSDDVALQNNCLFVYDLLQKNLATAFHKTGQHSHNTRDENLNVPITKTLTYGLQSFTSSSIRGWNSMNSKTNIDLASP